MDIWRLSRDIDLKGKGMRKVYFFGTGNCAKMYADKTEIALKTLGNYEIMGFLDNDVNKEGMQFGKYKVFKPDILREYPCDLVLVFLLNDDDFGNVYKQLLEYVPYDIIHECFFPLKLLLQNSYKDTADKEIQETLDYVSANKISVFNQFINKRYTYDEVKWDTQVDLPYIDFMTIEGKKKPMYYPRNYNFFKKNGIHYIYNLMYEQNEGSPHLYIKKYHNINDGDCIIDAGVCEGNFALKYIDVASHIYLFEMDPVWQEPLKYTFRDYESKVTLIDKAVCDRTSSSTCRIDDVLRNHKVDFVKMDIEGAEVSALRGASSTFCTNHIKASICSYHRSKDEEKIRFLLESYGYQTSVSPGYMLFLHDEEVWRTGELRRGIVYGDK